MVATIGMKSFSDSLTDKKVGSNESCRQASDVIESTINNKTLSVRTSIIGQASSMLSKLDKRYNFKLTASRFAKMAELASMRYSRTANVMPAHIDKMAGIVMQLCSMGTIMNETLVIGILAKSVEGAELRPVTASMRTLFEADINLKAV